MAPAGTYYTTEREHSIRVVAHVAFFKPSYGAYRADLKALGLTHWTEQQRQLVAAGKLVQTEGGGVRVPTWQDDGESQTVKGEL